MDEQMAPNAWDEEIDLRHYLVILLRWKWLIIAVTLLLGIGTFVISGFLPKTYESSAEVAIMISQIQPDGGKALTGISQIPDFRLSFPLVSSLALSKSTLQQIVEQLNLNVSSIEDFSRNFSVTDLGAKDGHLLIKFSAKAQSANEAHDVANAWTGIFVSGMHSFVAQAYFEPLRRLMMPRVEMYFQELEEKEVAWRDFSASNPVPRLEAQVKDLTQRVTAGETQLMELNQKIAMTEMLLESTAKLVTKRVEEIHTALSEQERLVLEEFQKSQKALEDFDRQYNLSALEARINQIQTQLVAMEGRLREIPGLLEKTQNELHAAEEERKLQERFITLRQAISQDSFLMDIAQDQTGGNLSNILGLSLNTQIVNPVYDILDSKVVEKKLAVQNLKKEADVLKGEIENYSQLLQQLREQYANLSAQREILTQAVESNRAAHLSLVEQKSRIMPLAYTKDTPRILIEKQSVFPELVQLLQQRVQLLADLDAYKIQRSTLESQLEEYRRKLSETQQKFADAMMEQDRLLRDLEVVRSSYAGYHEATAFLESLNVLEKDDSFWQKVVQVVSPATLPTKPISPRRMVNTAVASLAGLFVSVLAAFFLEFWRGTQVQTKA